jgi:hypothetical protein
VTVKFGTPTPGSGVQVPAFNLAQIAGTAIAAVFDNTDNAGGAVVGRLAAEGFLWNSRTSIWERTRTPGGIVSKEANNVGSSLGVWTPAAGKKFRLQGFILSVTSNAAIAVAGINLFQLTDAGTPIPMTTFVTFLPGAAGPTGPPLLLAIVVMPGNGYLSQAANNALAGASTNALTVGQWAVDAWGSEE